MNYDFYVGTNSVRGSRGIYRVELDGEHGGLSLREVLPFYNSGYLVRSHTGDRLYVACEGMTFRGAASGGLVTYDLTGGHPQVMSSQVTHGQRPCHISLAPDGSRVYAANFFGGTIGVFPVDRNGVAQAADHVIRHERTPAFRAGVHCVTPHPGGRYLAAIELAHNAVFFYDLERDCRVVYVLELEPGLFPRHLEFSHDGRFLYLLSQEKSLVYTYLFCPEEREMLREIQRISTIPPEFRGRNEPAAIRLNPGGTLLAVSNRGVGTGTRLDSVTLYRRDGETGCLTLSQIMPTEGQTPRDLGFSPDGSWLLVGLQLSDTLESFRVDEARGTLTRGTAGFPVPSPACIG